MVFYHTNTPRWRETFRVSLSPEKMLRAHLRFQFVHCSSDSKDKSEKKFCYSFLPMCRKGMVLTSSEHVLPLYKYETTLDSSYGPPAYLSAADSGANRFQKDFTVRLQLSSTSFTQNEQVFLLLRWKMIKSDEELKQALHLIQFSPPAAKDILPFLRDFLDALFSVMEKSVLLLLSYFDHCRKQEVFGQLVFQAVVVVVGIVINDKNSAFRSVLDDYIRTQFRFQHAHHSLLLWLRVIVAAQANTQPKEEESYIKFSHVMRALEYIFKLMIRSRHCYQEVCIITLLVVHHVRPCKHRLWRLMWLSFRERLNFFLNILPSF